MEADLVGPERRAMAACTATSARMAASVADVVDALLEAADEARREALPRHAQPPQFLHDEDVLGVRGWRLRLVNRHLEVEWPAGHGRLDVAVHHRHVRDGATVLHGGLHHRARIECDARALDVDGRAGVTRQEIGGHILQPAPRERVPGRAEIRVARGVGAVVDVLARIDREEREARSRARRRRQPSSSGGRRRRRSRPSSPPPTRPTSRRRRPAAPIARCASSRESTAARTPARCRRRPPAARGRARVSPGPGGRRTPRTSHRPMGVGCRTGSARRRAAAFCGVKAAVRTVHPPLSARWPSNESRTCAASGSADATRLRPEPCGDSDQTTRPACELMVQADPGDAGVAATMSG